MKSVTKILGRLFPMNATIPKHILENARQRGIAVHKWIEEYNDFKSGNLDKYPTISLEYQIYADYYKEWYEDYEVEPLYSELKLSIPDSDDEEGYVGVIDMVCKTKYDEKCLVSFKITYSYDLAYCELQESAYNHLLYTNEIVDQKIPAKLLHISKTGYNYISLNDQWDLFWKLKQLDSYVDGCGK